MSIDAHEAAFGCARVMAEHNGGETIVLDLRKLSSWTDFFVISSATSSTHLRGLARLAEEYLGPLGWSPLKRPSLAEDEQWCLLDFGDFVLHIMGTEARSFYELDKLWFQAEMSAIEPPEHPPAPDR